ncbi:MAG TPA: YceI family protein [Paenalcaligenes sp.]|nr:YceI family protein [Paenalcaligenes sp.]
MKKTAVAALFGVAFGLGAAAHADTYEVDSENSVIEFQYKQMGVNMKGSFANLQGSIVFDEAEPDKMAAQIELPLDTVDTGTEEADDELIKPEWFDMANHPAASFESTQVTPADTGEYTVDGVLQIKGETQELAFPVTVSHDDAGNLIFETEFEIDRGDFDVGSGSWSDPSIVSNEVKVKARVVSK